MAGYLRESNANLGGPFGTSIRSDALVVSAHHTAASFLGCEAEKIALKVDVFDRKGNKITVETKLKENSAAVRVLAPATLEDARGMLWTAQCDPDPVLVFEHGSLYPREG